MKPSLIFFFLTIAISNPFPAAANTSSIPSSKKVLNNAYNPDTLIVAHRMGCGPNRHRHDDDCMHRGRQHRRGRRHGMMHGMGRGPGLEGEAQCPQPRSTAKAPEGIYESSNPLKNTPENIEEGRLLFQLNAQPTCTMCHGSGDGLGMMSGGLNPPPRNFMCKETMENIPDGQLFWIIKNGSPGTGMPAFSELADEQIWSLILFIRQLGE